jgi:hypothetical protein
MSGAPVTLTRSRVLEALADGSAAAQAGLDAPACPYSAAGRVDERLLAGAWVRGYLRALGTID